VDCFQGKKGGGEAWKEKVPGKPEKIENQETELDPG
jgi:hypothetical protein